MKKIRTIQDQKFVIAQHGGQHKEELTIEGNPIEVKKATDDCLRNLKIFGNFDIPVMSIKYRRIYFSSHAEAPIIVN